MVYPQKYINCSTLEPTKIEIKEECVADPLDIDIAHR
jgi:hypothetical protein